MPLIDMHIHLLPNVLLQAYERRESPPFLRDEGSAYVVRYGPGYAERIPREVTDPRHVIRTLDAHSVDVAVLSINQPGVLGLPPEEACVTARAANDELAEVVGGSGGRLAGLAVLPWQCPTEAAVELQRAVGIGLRGAMAYSNVAGRHVDDPDFEPIFAATASLDVPLLLHPAMPLSAPTLGDYGLSCAVGFLFDSTTAILRLILSGLLDRHPGLKIIVGHAGSLLPQLAGRLDLEQARGMIFGAHARRSSLSGDYLRCLYTDTAGGSVPAVASALRLFGSGHVMFGTDFPFWSHDVNLNVLERLPLSSEEMQAVRGQVARELFRLDG